MSITEVPLKVELTCSEEQGELIATATLERLMKEHDLCLFLTNNFTKEEIESIANACEISIEFLKEMEEDEAA